MEVTREAVKVLERVAIKVQALPASTRKRLLGGIAIKQTGSPFPPETEKRALAADATLMGAVGLPEYDNALPPRNDPRRDFWASVRRWVSMRTCGPVRTYAC